MHRFLQVLSVLTLSVLLCTGVSFAQNVTGTVGGVVSDPTGAVVSGATVVAHNTDTGVDTQATTNGSGVYNIRFLPIGKYQVTVSAPGFSSQQFPVFTLEINQSAKFDAKLQVGNVSTVAEVHGEVAPILNTNDSSLGISLSTNEIANFPLNGGNFSALTSFQPGAVTTNPTEMSGGNAIERQQSAGGEAAFNGNRNQANNYTLEGVDMNQAQDNFIAYSPAPEALGEVRVITANASAAYGNSNGGSVVLALRSGTNHFHGSAYAHLENYNLDANSWWNKYQHPIIPKKGYTQTIFGGTVGGPIFRNKLFFFMDYMGVRRHEGGVGTTGVLTPAMRQGDFSALLTQAGGNTQLYDTQNNFAPYPNNQIPIVNPVAKFLFAHPELYPLPNASPSSGLLSDNYQAPTKSSTVNNQGDIKISWDKSATDRLVATYSQSNSGHFSPPLIPVNFSSPAAFPTKLGGGSWIHTFSSAIVNEARIGFTRTVMDGGTTSDPTGVFGLTGKAKVGIPFLNQSRPGFTSQDIGGGATGGGTGGSNAPNITNTFNYQDNLTWQHGRHLLSMGVQALRYQQNYPNGSGNGPLGSMSYSGDYTSNPSITTGGNNGYSVADFVLDRVHETNISSGLNRVGQRQWRASGYIQDDFKVNSRLTLNLALRYEFDQPWYESNNKTSNVLLGSGIVEYANSVPVGAPAGSIVCPTRACYNANYKQIMPRLGFALQAMPRFVLRGGYAATSFFEGYSYNQRLTTNRPFASNSKVTNPTPNNSDAGRPSRVEDGFPLFQANGFAGIYSAWLQDSQPAYVHQFNLTTEYALTNKLSLSVGYVGESGQHLAVPINVNQLTLAQARAAGPDEDNPLPGGVAPYFRIAGQSGPVYLTASSAMMNYNGGQATLRQRSSHGFEYTLNYTYSKSLTNSGGDYGPPGIDGANLYPQEASNLNAEYGPSGGDIRHNISAIGVYTVPFGHGQAYGGSTNRLVDFLAGGWKISGTLINYSGLPITITGGNNSHTYTAGVTRANQYRKIVVRHRSLDNWWGTDPSAASAASGSYCTNGHDNGTCAYGDTAQYTFGSASQYTERAPGYRQIDSSMFKDFHLFGEHAVGFRADFFNLFNIASYGNPKNRITDSSFGKITGTRSKERQIQLSAYYNF